MSSLTGNKTVLLLAMLTVRFAVASSAIAMPTAAFASGYNDDGDKYNGHDDNGHYWHPD
jgi:hypothetical protein